MSDPHKNWLVQKQTALGKDTSNPLMADNLQKIVWYSTHHITLMKNWLIQKQTTLSKDKSNPLMADNLPKIVWYSTHHVTLIKKLASQKKTALGKDKSNPLTIDSLLKTIWLSIDHHLTNEVLTIPGQTQLFWNTVVVKQSNDVTRLQALVDKKKVVITEATIRDALRLDDAEGVDFLPNEEIFAELASLALDACAALTRRVEHLEYDKVAQALEITKLERRVKKLKKANKVKVLKLRRLKKVGTSQRIGSSDDTVMEDASNQGRMIDVLDNDAGVALMDDKEEEKKVKEAKVAGDDQVQGRQAEIYKIDMDHASKVLKVVTAASELVTAASTTIVAAEPQVPAATITTARVRVVVASTRRRKGVVIRDLEEESTTIRPAETKSKDKGKRIMVEEPKLMKKNQQFIQKKQEEKRIKEEQAAQDQNSKIPACSDDDDDYSAITPNEPVDSLSMGDEHLNTIPATESNELIKSCVENLVPNPSEFEGENGCDVFACFTTFSNILFDAEYESDSSDYQSCSDEDFSEEIFSNPLFKEEIIPMKIDQHHFNVDSDLIESMLYHDSSVILSSSKIDSLLDEFAGELTLLKSISPGINETDCYLENDIRLIERLLYDNSSPCPPEEFVFDNSDADIESFSPSPIPDEDSDSRMEETDLTFTSDYPMPPSIEEDDDDSKRDVLILEELPSNYSLLLPEIESFYFDIPSFSRPPAKPLNCNTGILNIKMLGDDSEQKLSNIPENLKTLAKGFYPPSLNILSFNWESWNVEDKILVPKLPKNCARCAKCGHPVDGPYCQGCSLLRKKLEEDLVTYFQDFQNTSESSDDSTNVVNAPREPFVVKQDHSVNPPHIDECFCECGDALDGIFCQQCTCKSCGKGAHIGYNCPPKVLIISNPKPCNQTMNNELLQTLPSFDPTSRTTLMEQMTTLTSMCEMVCQIVQKKQEEKRIEDEQAANARYWKIPACCNDDDDYNSAITPVLSTEEPDNSLSMRDEHLDTILATESNEVIKSSVKDLVPIPTKYHFEIVTKSNDDISSSDDDSLYNENIEYVEASPHDSEVLSLEVEEIVISEKEEIEDDNLREKLLNVYLLIANIEALKDNPTPSFELLTKSSSTSPKSFLEETNTFRNSLPEFENFCFNLEEISSGSITTHSDISLPDYEAFYFDDDHIEEISSGSTTTHSDISLFEYDSFTFDLSNDLFPPTNRSDFTHEEFIDELAHIISPPEYDCFYFRNLPDPGELISILNSKSVRTFLQLVLTYQLRMITSLFWRMLYGSLLHISRIPLFLLIFTHSGMKIPSLTQASPLIVFIRLSRVYLIGVELLRNSIRHLNESPMEMLFSTCSSMNQ
uniref:CCHC-type domain-containing protein n=1 Tax=Tanacetum cinerariifolium TaxID=118510 RepID=A0A6L2P8I1_TANCI|nr:hypothetical protein [Tanacetum cinerariifolium]